MCILFIYTDPNPKAGTFRLILASNRDEYFARPAQPAELCSETKIISGGYIVKISCSLREMGISLFPICSLDLGIILICSFARLSSLLL